MNRIFKANPVLWGAEDFYNKLFQDQLRADVSELLGGSESHRANWKKTQRMEGV